MPAVKIAQYIQNLPCSKHGHPGILSSKLAAWVEFYKVVVPYSPSFDVLDHSLISKLCDETGIPFGQAFEMLSLIHAINKEVHAKDVGRDQDIRI
jgi:hypothetical protein